MSFARNGWAGSRTQTPPPPATRGGWESSRGGYSDRGARGNARAGDSRASGELNGWNGSRSTSNWSAPASRTDSPATRENFGYGHWKDGKHVVGGRNTRLEKELFGELNDPTKQHTGINFERYEDIPVEATGAGVPEPVTSFDGSPLDPVLQENIGYAHYSTPTPVQKYSIPIVAGGRDLMACAQVIFSCQINIMTNPLGRRVLGRQLAFSSQFCPLLSPKDLVLPRISPSKDTVVARLILLL